MITRELIGKYLAAKDVLEARRRVQERVEGECQTAASAVRSAESELAKSLNPEIVDGSLSKVFKVDDRYFFFRLYPEFRVIECEIVAL